MRLKQQMQGVMTALSGLGYLVCLSAFMWWSLSPLRGFPLWAAFLLGAVANALVAVYSWRERSGPVVGRVGVTAIFAGIAFVFGLLASSFALV